MADFQFNIAKGKTNAFTDRVANNDPATAQYVLVLFQAIEADALLQDRDDLATIIAQAGNTECDFTNYARQVYTDSDLAAAAVDDANDNQATSLPTRSIANAGGALNNNGAKAILCYDATQGGDATLIPVLAWDAAFVTNGQALNIPAAEVFEAS